jgi:putative PIG3 family NAD(P)H quinone oxidoreductase
MADLPTHMRAIEISAPGEPDVLRVCEREVPKPGPHDVLIAVAAAGVNRPDCLQRRGLYPPPPGASDIPGLEVAGRIAAVGSKVTGWATGDPVCALLAGGGYAEYCSVPAVQCLPVPAGFSFVEAAAVPETLFTVWANVVERGGLQAGENFLVHGGASGIGTMAIQLAKALGANVYATAGSAAKTQLCEQLGATYAVNYNEADFLPVLKEKAGGMDLILDIVGGSYLDSNIKLLNKAGRLVVIGVLGGTKGTLNLGLMLSKHIRITGSTLRARSAKEKGRIAGSLRSMAWPHLEDGSIRPVIQANFTLDNAAAAHRLLEANDAAGKVVLSVNEALLDSAP